MFELCSILVDLFSPLFYDSHVYISFILSCLCLIGFFCVFIKMMNYYR